MSMHPQNIPDIPIETVQVARAAFPKGNMYLQIRDTLGSIYEDDNEIVVIKRRERPSVALISESELSSLLETVYLLRSPENALRLFAALEWSKSNDEKPVEPITVEQAIEQLKEKLGIVEEEAS